MQSYNLATPMLRNVGFYVLFAGAFLIPKHILARPDVFFIDTKKHDVYLKHLLKEEDNQEKIKFELSKDIININLPDKYYDLELLKAYIAHDYPFSTPAMKNEFIRMFEKSIDSAFTLEHFLAHLLLVLARFEISLVSAEPEGCSSAHVNNFSLYGALMAFFLWRLKKSTLKQLRRS